MPATRLPAHKARRRHAHAPPTARMHAMLLLLLVAAAAHNSAASTMPQAASLQLMQRQRLARFDGLLAQLLPLISHDAAAAERLLASYMQQQRQHNALDDAALLMAAGGEAQLLVSVHRGGGPTPANNASGSGGAAAATHGVGVRRLLSAESAAASSATTRATLTGSLESLGDVRAAAMNTVHRHATDAREVELPTDEAPPFRIVGGVQAPKNRYTWVCSLKSADASMTHFCGCSLIAPRVVLTAGHCLDHDEAALSRPWVEIGRYYLGGGGDRVDDDGTSYERIRCAKSSVHPSWSFQAGTNDIALCFLESASDASPVTLAAPGLSLSTGTAATVIGWGAQREGGGNAPVLMEVDVALTSMTSCNATYNNRLKSTQLCAGLPEGGADACQGDSGGPLFLKGASAEEDVQIGIVSFGSGCGRPRVPGVYTDVRDYGPFMARQLLFNGIDYEPLTGRALAARDPGSPTASSVTATDGSAAGAAATEQPQQADASPAPAAVTTTPSSNITLSAADVLTLALGLGQLFGK